MKKVYIYIIVFAGLFCFTGFALADTTITNPLAPGGVNNFGDLLSKIAVGVGTLIASLGTIMLIVAGILYLTSAGSPERIGTAKKALIYAVIGIAVGLAATSIVSIVQGIMNG